MAAAIALADDSVIVREGVARVLAAQPGGRGELMVSERVPRIRRARREARA